MPGRLLIGFLVGGGVLLTAVGVQRWFDGRAAQTTVRRFVKAVDEGDRQAALALLTPERRDLVETGAESPTTHDWVRQDGVEYRMRELRIDGNSAVARLEIEKEGFYVRPTLHLRRGRTTRWKIARAQNVRVDPRWRQMKQAVERQRDNKLADTLQQALRGRAGVTVERLEPAEPSAAGFPAGN